MTIYVTVCGEIEYVMQSQRAKWSSLLVFFHFFHQCVFHLCLGFWLSIDVTEGLETGKTFWLWCYFKVDGSRRKYTAYPPELFHLTQTTQHLPVGNISCGFGRSWILTCLSCSQTNPLLFIIWWHRGSSSAKEDLGQYLNYNSCSANCSLGQHWIGLELAQNKMFLFCSTIPSILVYLAQLF